LVNNDEESLTYDIVEDGSIDGEIFEDYYFDEEDQICMTEFTVEECIVVYDTTVKAKLIAIIRYYYLTDADRNQKKLIVEVYDENEITYLVREGQNLVLDTSREKNPVAHNVTGLIKDQEGKLRQKLIVPWTHLGNLHVYICSRNKVVADEWQGCALLHSYPARYGF
jgi:Phage portal protein, SPP1 Gp6-like